MKRRSVSFITAFVSILVSISALADQHEMAGPLGYGQAISMNASDPAAIVDAISKFRASATGQKNPANVSLSQVVAGGEPGVTHTILVTYDTAAEIDQSNAINAASRDFAQAVETMQSASERRGTVLFSLLRRNIKEGAVTSSTPVSWLYALTVTDQEAFMEAFDKIWAATAAAFPGNAFFGEALVNGSNTATHFVSFQANDMQTLLSGMAALENSQVMAEYFANAASFRSIESETISRGVMAWPSAAN